MKNNKQKFDWNKLAEKGYIHKKVKEDLRDLKKQILTDEILTKKKEPDIIKEDGTLSDEIYYLLKTKFESIYSKYEKISKKDKKNLWKEFQNDLINELDLILNKKALCSIRFNGFSIYQFFKALSSILFEIEFNISKNGIEIVTMDPLRISIIQIKIKNRLYRHYKSKKLGVNLEELTKLIKCKSGDNSKTNLILGKEKIFINIESKKFYSSINRTLKAINFQNTTQIDLEPLENNDYPIKFNLLKEELDYLIDNFGFDSGLINIACYSNKITFSETNGSIENKLTWEKDIKINMRKIKEKIEGDVPFFQNSYSFDFFKIIYEISRVLDNSHNINFSIKEDFPLKTTIDFKKLGNVLITLYISPRN